MSAGAAVTFFCNMARLANSAKAKADCQRGKGPRKSSAKAIAASVKNTAVVSIKNVRPQKRYRGLDQTRAQKIHVVSRGTFKRVAIAAAGQAQPSRNPKLTRRPTGSSGH